MSDADKEQKTELPTEKRKKEFREQGQIALSQDLIGAAVFVVGFALIAGTAAKHTQTMLSLTRSAFRLETLPLTELVWTLASLIAPFALAAMGVAVVTGFAQVGLPDKLTPRVHYNPLGKLASTFSTDTLIRLLKQLARTGTIGFVIYRVLEKDWTHLVELGRGQLPGALAFLGSLLLKVGTHAAFVLAAFGALDLVLQRRRLTQRMMMTKEEVRREMKEEMPSPELKGKRRQMARAMAKNRTAKAVRQADVVIVNPTHYAVALSYKQGKMGAPKVVAKGIDFLALRMKDIAAEAKVPIVENVPLARALYAQVKVGRDIPVELYKAVAEVLAIVYRRKRR